MPKAKQHMFAKTEHNCKTFPFTRCHSKRVLLKKNHSHSVLSRVIGSSAVPFDAWEAGAAVSRDHAAVTALRTSCARQK